MGEVWRAKDTKLGREVAIKTLPAEFAQDVDRLARFEREAKLLASLNHPNITAIYGFEEDNGTHFLVMELVEGDTLADRVGRGAVPVEESLKLALQIAEALEAAHERGVIHRDLKPANIKITADDKVKVLDFGLAKAFAGDEGEVNPANSPTLSMQATQQGMILGTAAYMSPEQARGRTVDTRTDVWAFGCVLFEMLTGRSTFAGDDVSLTLARVLEREPEFAALPQHLHPRLKELLERCLEKEAKDRLAGVSDARVDIQKVLADPAGLIVQPVDEVGEVVRATPQSKLAWVTTALITALVAGSAVWVLRTPAPPESGPIVRFSHLLGEENFTRRARALVDISRDGTQLAYVADSQIFLRRLDETEARPVVGTDENPSTPFFSPDGESLGFWSSDAELKRIPVGGGTPVTLTPATNPFGVRWGEDNTIVYGMPDGVWQVAGTGGAAERIVETAQGEQVYGPQILPGGTHILYAVSNGRAWDEAEIVVEDLETHERKTVWTGGNDPRYVPTGHLVYAFENDLFALRLDLETLAVDGGQVSLVRGVQRSGGNNAGTANYAISDEGTLVQIPGAGAGGDTRVLAFMDRDGNAEILDALPRDYGITRLSPGESRIAVEILGDESTTDIWIYDIRDNVLNQLTPDGGTVPLWTPDGTQVTFLKDASLWNIQSDFSGGQTELAGTGIDGIAGPGSWSPDGEVLLFASESSGIHAWSREDTGAEGAGSVEQIVAPSDESSGAIMPQFSPDGRWFVYSSNETGNVEIYAYPYPRGSAGRQTITTDGGVLPVWPRESDELVFLNNRTAFMQAVRIQTDPTLRRSNPIDLFSLPGRGITVGAGATAMYDMTPNGERLLVAILEGSGGTEDDAEDFRRINIVLNWFEELRERVPVQ